MKYLPVLLLLVVGCAAVDPSVSSFIPIGQEAVFQISHSEVYIEGSVCLPFVESEELSEQHKEHAYHLIKFLGYKREKLDGYYWSDDVCFSLDNDPPFSYIEVTEIE